MQTDLNKKYGYCEILKGALLYRGHSDDNNSDQLFFTTNYHSAFKLSNGLQIWKTKKKIEIIFLLRYIDSFSKGKSSIPDLYYDIYPNESNKSLDDLNIKQDIKRRDPFARHLFLNYNIHGWFSTIEDGRTDFEVCLFNKQEIKESLELSSVVHSNYDDYYFECLKKIKFYPNDDFYKKSQEKIISRMRFENEGKDPFKLHLSRVKNLIDCYVKEGQSLDKCKHYNYDIRLKLRI